MGQGIIDLEVLKKQAIEAGLECIEVQSEPGKLKIMSSLGERVFVSSSGKMTGDHLISNRVSRLPVMIEFHQSYDKEYTNTPVTITPLSQVQEKRFLELKFAIQQYATLALKIDSEWVAEYNNLFDTMQNRD